MNVPLPAGLFNNNAYFYANNTFNLGSISKPVNAVTLVSIDYSQLPGSPTNFSTWWFQVDVGSQPPLTVTNPILTGSVFTFLLSNGVPGITYNLDINIAYGTGPITRTDTIIVEIPSDDCGCGTGAPSFPSPGAPITIPTSGNIAGFLTGEGLIFLNSGVRFFVSGVAPASANILDVWYNSITQVTSMLITDGSNLIWLSFNETPQVETEGLFSEHLNVISLNTVSPLTHAYDGNIIKLVVNGLAFFPLGPSPPFHMSSQNIVWTSSTFSIPVDAVVIAEYSYSIQSSGNLYQEQLTVTALNVLSALTHTHVGIFIELIVNGQTFSNVGSSPAFSVSGNTITWLSTMYNIAPGATVIAVYSY